MQASGYYSSDDDNLKVEYLAQIDKNGDIDPSDIEIVQVTIFGVVEPLKNLSQELRKAIMSVADEVDFDDVDHVDHREE